MVAAGAARSLLRGQYPLKHFGEQGARRKDVRAERIVAQRMALTQQRRDARHQHSKINGVPPTRGVELDSKLVGPFEKPVNVASPRKPQLFRLGRSQRADPVEIGNFRPQSFLEVPARRRGVATLAVEHLVVTRFRNPEFLRKEGRLHRRLSIVRIVAHADGFDVEDSIAVTDRHNIRPGAVYHYFHNWHSGRSNVTRFARLLLETVPQELPLLRSAGSVSQGVDLRLQLHVIGVNDSLKKPLLFDAARLQARIVGTENDLMQSCD